MAAEEPHGTSMSGFKLYVRSHGAMEVADNLSPWSEHHTVCLQV